MKILHYEAGQKLFGGAYQVAGLVERLRDDFEHHLFCAEGSEIAKRLGALAEVHTTPIRGDLDPRPYFELKRVIRKIHPDIVHVHSRRGADLWGPMAARKLRIPFILCRRVDNLEPGWLFRYRAKKAAGIVGISQKIGEVIESMSIPKKRIEIIRSGVDTTAYQPRARTGKLLDEFKLDKDTLVIGMAAQFIPRKGHLDLLAAAPDVIQEHPAAHFILFGNGAGKETIEKHVEARGLSAHFSFPGFRNDLDALFPELDLLVHPAHTEGLGVTLLQATACGVPIVATATGGIPEVVHEGLNGHLVGVQNPSQLSAAINRLLADPEKRQRFGKAGRTFALQEASLDETLRLTTILYNKIALEDTARRPT